MLLNIFPHDTKMEHVLFGCHGFGVMTISDVLSLAATQLCVCNLRFVMNCNTIVDRQEGLSPRHKLTSSILSRHNGYKLKHTNSCSDTEESDWVLFVFVCAPFSQISI